MEPKFKRVSYVDEWIVIGHSMKLGPPYEFKNYALGWLLEATARELALIEANEMFGEQALILRSNERGFTFAEVLGPEFIPEVSRDPEHLLKVQAYVSAAAAKWTIFFDSME
jgi:hypothetical protein